MSLLEILIYPDPRLKRKSIPVRDINKSIFTLLEDMAEIMYNAPGVGLAAPQVGKNIRVIVIDVEHNENGNNNLIELINPVIIDAKGMFKGEEACLSIPGFTAEVKRSAEITVEGLNRKGELLTIYATELISRVLQHEIDHLDGILFIDRLSRLRRELIKKKVNRAFPKKRS